MPKLFWPTALIPNLLAIRQSRNLFNFGQYRLFIDYIFHVLHTKVVYKERKAEKLPYNFIYVARAITSTLMAVAQNETYQQIVNGQYVPVCLSYIKMKPCKTANAKDQNL